MPLLAKLNIQHLYYSNPSEIILNYVDLVLK